ncbi:hypothetical protein J4448_06605 [Candidatus Woesearchaeota archaeon]|nr:hypothetical protein [Candidatus Woesearchaeota archaeon]
MTKTFQRTENGQYYVGKVRDIKPRELGVSVFVGQKPKSEEYIFDINRAHFPRDVKVGDVFKYFPNGAVELVQSKELSELELQTLLAEVETQLQQNEF